MENYWRIFIKKHPKQRQRVVNRAIKDSCYIESLGIPFKNIERIQYRDQSNHNTSYHKLHVLWEKYRESKFISDKGRYMIKILSTRSHGGRYMTSVRIVKGKQYMIAPNFWSLDKRKHKPTYFTNKKVAMEFVRNLVWNRSISIYPDLIFLIDRHTGKETLFCDNRKTNTPFNQIFLLK